LIFILNVDRLNLCKPRHLQLFLYRIITNSVLHSSPNIVRAIIPRIARHMGHTARKTGLQMLTKCCMTWDIS